MFDSDVDSRRYVSDNNDSSGDDHDNGDKLTFF